MRNFILKYYGTIATHMLIACLSQNASSTEFERLRQESLAILNRVENITAAKVRGQLKTKSYISDDVLDFRGNSFWYESDKIWGSDRTRTKVEKEISDRLLIASGTTGVKPFHSYHEGKSYSFSPINLHLRIETKPSSFLSSHRAFMTPKRWVSFTEHHNIPFLYLSSIVQLSAPRVTVVDQGDSIRLEQTSDVSESKQPAYASRWLVIDKATKCVPQYGFGGGGMGEAIGIIQWKQNDKNLPFPCGGKWTVNGETVTEWRIDELITDLKSLRKSFVPVESKLPIGTRISDHSLTPMKTRYSGGDDIGKREHVLRVEAMRKIREASR